MAFLSVSLEAHKGGGVTGKGPTQSQHWRHIKILGAQNFRAGQARKACVKLLLKHKTAHSLAVPMGQNPFTALDPEQTDPCTAFQLKASPAL